MVGVCVLACLCVKREKETKNIIEKETREREKERIRREERERERGETKYSVCREDKREGERSLRSIVARVGLLVAVALCVGCPESEVVTKELHD